MEEKKIYEINYSEDEELNKFILNTITSFEIWDILKLYYRNPNVNATIENIAKVIGRDEDKTKEALKILKENNFLKSKILKNEEIFLLINNKKNLQIIKSFFKYCEDSINRFKIVYNILQNKTLKNHK